MSVHVLHLTVHGSRFDAIEREVSVHVARYTGWSDSKAASHVDSEARVDLYPIARRPRAGVVYRADVTVAV